MRLFTRRLVPCAALVCALLAPASSSATSTPTQIKAAKTAAVGYLKSTQEPSGNFAGFNSDWDLTSLAAAGVAAADVSQPGGTDARTYYRGLFGDPTKWPGAEAPVAEFERAALTAYAAGIDPARISPAQNLIARVVAGYQPSAPGYYGSSSNFTGALFGLLALADTKTRSDVQRVPQALLEKSVSVLRANQHTDGGWTFEKAEGNSAKLAEPSEPDETGAAIAALCTAGVPNTDAAVANGVRFLEKDLVAATGAFNAPFGVNTDSNAWGVEGLDACAVNPQGPAFTTTTGKTPVDFLLSEQVAGGGFKFEPAETEANEYSSQDALRAISGAGFTARPPASKTGAPRWVFESSFSSGVSSPLALIVDDGTPNLKVCSVSLAPTGATTTLAAVLAAAQTSSTPTGCVSGFAPASGSGPITQINGTPNPAEPRWNLSVDGGKELPAKRSSKIKLGDTISLRLK